MGLKTIKNGERRERKGNKSKEEKGKERTVRERGREKKQIVKQELGERR